MRDLLQNRTLNNTVALLLLIFDGWLALSTDGIVSILFGIIAGIAFSSLIMINLPRDDHSSM